MSLFCTPPEVSSIVDGESLYFLELLLLPLSFSARGERDNVQLSCATFVSEKFRNYVVFVT